MKKIIGLIVVGTLLLGCATTNVNINANVTDAKVIVNGKLLGQTPINSIKIKNNSGRSYQVIIEKEGYKTYQGTLRTEEKTGAMVAVVIGYSFCWLVLPALLLINVKYISGPMPDQYFVLEEEK
ncbi:MAG: PEGA domain-containing protein [Treponema sp.]|nr:PEGA domain-containing protein [Treponema sp.]